MNLFKIPQLSLLATIMIPRNLLRRSRVNFARSFTITPASLLRPHRSPLQLSSISGRTASRCYSTAPEAPDTAKDEPQTEAVSGTQTSDRDLASKELESKDKEIIELKVYTQFPFHCTHLVIACTTSRIDTSAQLPNSETCKIVRSATSMPLVPLPSPASPLI